MSDFDAHIRQRLSDAQRSLDQARALDDDYAVNLHLGELEGLSRIAADHGIAVIDHSVTVPDHSITVADHSITVEESA